MSTVSTNRLVPPTRGGHRNMALHHDDQTLHPPNVDTRAQTPEIPNDDLVLSRHATSDSSLVQAYNRANLSNNLLPSSNSANHTATKSIGLLKSLNQSNEQKTHRDYIKYPFMLYEDSDHYYYSDNVQAFWNETRSNIEDENNGTTFKDLSSGVTDFEEGDEQLREELFAIHTQTRAKTLWAISGGTSALEKTSSPFSNREEKVVNLDVRAIVSSRPASSGSTSRSARMSQQQTMIGPFSDLIESVDNSGSTFKQIDDSKDPTKRTYITNASGRSISSIYHPNTKRPSRISNFVESMCITNESLFTYISTENVTTLDLERCVELDNKILKSIGEYCPRLTSLNLQHCSQLRDSTIRIIVNGCSDIQNLNIGMCHLVTDESLVEIFTHCRKLRVLSIHSCEMVTGELSFHLTKNIPFLEVLDVSFCIKFSDLALQLLSEYCGRLKHLDISGCPLIQDEGLLSVCKHCPQIVTLRTTILSQPTITSDSLSLMTNYARNLEVLELSGIFQIKDACVMEICKYGKRLEFLSLSGCPQITDDSIHAISDHCQNLRCLEVAGCRKIGVQALLELIHKITKLKRLVVTRCNISVEELDILRKFTNGRVSVLKQEPIPKDKIKEYFTFIKEKTTKKKATKSKKGDKKKK